MHKRILLGGTLVVCFAAIAATRPYAQAATLPSAWMSRDIGTAGQAGFATWSSGTFTVSGAGADIWRTADAFHFAYRPLSGDVTVVARVASILGAQAWTKAGVMIRATTQAGSTHAMMLVSTSKGVAFQRRVSTGGVSTNTSAAGGAPRWVKLTRSGSVITASVSSDGGTWTVVGHDTLSLGSTVLVGLAVSSHDPTRLATATFDNVSVSVPTATSAATKPWAHGRLRVVPGSHFVRHETTGRHFLYLADTGWALMRGLNRADADLYLRDCVAKGFTVVNTAALWNMSRTNAYGDRPFGTTNGKYDPNRILTTPGNDPANSVEYDYWDHVDYVLDRAEALGLYVAMQATWGNYVSGTTSWAFDMSSNIFTVANARTYGTFIGRRYGHRPNIIWILGGDRSAVYPNGDFRAVWRSMAEGIGRGVTGQALTWSAAHSGWNQLLMTYLATKRDTPGSSVWFHTDPWLDVNGIQSEYHSITGKVALDWNKPPTKPTAVLEARYENEMSTDYILFTGGFRQRYQLYHALLSGSIGYGYGHASIWNFVKTGTTWQMGLNDPGRVGMKYARRLLEGLSNSDLLSRVPDQTLLDGALGSAKTQDLLVAMRTATRRLALAYSTNGRDIRLNVGRLAAGMADAFWFSPRTGALTSAGSGIPTGSGTAIRVFNPPGSPGSGNDWVLKVVVR